MPILIMSIMGILFGLGLAFASRIFKVNIDPRVERILSALPGANCGVCGKAGCAALAEAIAKGDASLASCPAGGEEASNKIAEILGVEKKPATKKNVHVRCGGGTKAKDKYLYKGVETCMAATLLLGGQKLCKFGCLGFEDCVRACPFDALHMGKEGVPIVDPEKCTTCGKCIEACPKDIISLEAGSGRFFIKCLSQDKATFVKNACEVGCIACKICEKLSKGAFIVENNLARLDYSKVDSSTPFEACVEKCPTRCIVNDVLIWERGGT